MAGTQTPIPGLVVLGGTVVTLIQGCTIYFCLRQSQKKFIVLFLIIISNNIDVRYFHRYFRFEQFRFALKTEMDSKLNWFSFFIKLCCYS